MNRIAVAKELTRVARELSAGSELYEFKNLRGKIEPVSINVSTRDGSAISVTAEVELSSGGRGGSFVTDTFDFDDEEAKEKAFLELDAAMLKAAKKFDAEIARIMAKHGFRS